MLISNVISKNLFIQILIYLIIGSLFYLFIDSFKFYSTLTDLIYQIFDLLLIIIIFRLYDKENLANLTKSPLKLSIILLTLLFSIIIRIFGVLPIFFIGEKTAEADVLQQYKDLHILLPKNYIDLFILLTSNLIIPPLSEELLFRGVIFTRLSLKMPAIYAIIISSLIFALLHTTNWTIFSFSLIIGIGLCIIYIKYKNIWYSIITHAWINLFALIITFLHH